MRLEIGKVVRLSSLLSPFSVDAEKTAEKINKSKKYDCKMLAGFVVLQRHSGNININF